MTAEFINPPFLERPRGYSHMARSGNLLLMGGVTGMDQHGVITCPGDLVGQMDQALANIKAALAHVGGQVTHIIRMRVYTTDMAAYRQRLPQLGGVWRQQFGKHYPAMALLGVSELFDPLALIEIEAEAILP